LLSLPMRLERPAASTMAATGIISAKACPSSP
jgi:hypothetical protein